MSARKKPENRLNTMFGNQAPKQTGLGALINTNNATSSDNSVESTNQENKEVQHVEKNETNNITSKELNETVEMDTIVNTPSTSEPDLVPVIEKVEVTKQKNESKVQVQSVQVEKVSSDLPSSAFQLIKMGPSLPRIDYDALTLYKQRTDKNLQDIITAAVRAYLPSEFYKQAEEEILEEERKKAEELLARLNRK